MSFLNIGALEFAFLIILILLIIGPNDLVSTARKIGGFVNQVKRTGFWKTVQDMRNKANQVGREIMDESGIYELKHDFDVMPDLDEFRRELDQYGFKPNNEEFRSNPVRQDDNPDPT